MAGNSENLGQVAGISARQTAPQNTSLIWWDNTPSQKCHKIYDFNLQQWVLLSQKVLSSITYNELKNLALSTGLPLGKFYVITNLGNILALSITSTKIQYVNTAGNLLVDDLGSNVQYYISSNNLTLDGVEGIFAQSSNKLDFTFPSGEPDLETFLLAKKTTPSSVSLLKFKISSLLSAKTGNNLKWSGGLYVNIKENITDLVDKVGGIVSYDAYSLEQSVQDQSIENIASNYSSLVFQTSKLIAAATTDEAILSKKITTLNVSGAPIDAAAGDSLYTVLSKFQRFINKFKIATGINLSPTFSTKGVSGEVNANDNVETAIAKLVVKQSNVKLSLPDDWKVSEQTNQNINPGDSYEAAFSKIEADREVVNSIQTAKFETQIALLNGYSHKLYSAFLSINNGILDLEIPDWNEVTISYSRVLEYDYTYIFDLKISTELRDRIGAFLPGYDEYSFTTSRTKSVENIFSVCVEKITTSTAVVNWESPKFLAELNLSFGYGFRTGNGVAPYKVIGLVLSPKLRANLEAPPSIFPVGVNTRIQELIGNDFSFQLPPVQLRYKLV